jgi:hypothetical protein
MLAHGTYPYTSPKIISSVAKGQWPYYQDTQKKLFNVHCNHPGIAVKYNMLAFHGAGRLVHNVNIKQI